MIENEKVKSIGKCLGELSDSEIHVEMIATMLNYIPSELKKDMVAAYNCVLSPEIIDEKTVDNARHLIAIIDRYMEDEDVSFQLPVWLNYDSSFQFTEELAELRGFLNGLKIRFENRGEMTL